MYDSDKIVVKRKTTEQCDIDIGAYEDGLTQLLFPEEEEVFVDGVKLGTVIGKQRFIY